MKKRRLPISNRREQTVDRPQIATRSQEVGYRFGVLIIMGMFLILVLVGLTFMIASFGKEYQSVELSALQTSENQQGFIFPSSNDTLIKGQTYTLRWTGGPPTIEEMYLVNRALAKDGVSISLADRFFNIENTGSFEITIPTNIPSGQYQIQAGSLTSEYFEVKDP